MSFDPLDWAVLHAVSVGGEAVKDRATAPRMGDTVEITVSGCAHSCCGKGWRRRDGYEQTYRGYIDNLTSNTFMLYSLGIGTISYVIAARADELEHVKLA